MPEGNGKEKRLSLLSTVSKGLLLSAPLMFVAGSGQAVLVSPEGSQASASMDGETIVVAEAEAEAEGEAEAEAEAEAEGEAEAEAEAEVGTGCYIPRLQEAAAEGEAEGEAEAEAEAEGEAEAEAEAEGEAEAEAAAEAEAPDVSEAELQAVYDCLLDHMRSAYGDEWQADPNDFAGWQGLKAMQAAYRDSGLDEAAAFPDWENVATAPYVSATHGERFVTNHVNDAGAEAYKRYEEIGEMPVGGIVAKPSFTVAPDGEAQLGPLFLMEKMAPGFYEASDDWKYSLIMPDGSIGGITQGQGAANVEMCIGCHMAAPQEQDSLLFLPENLRAR